MKTRKNIFKSKYFYIILTIVLGLILTIIYSKSIFDCDIMFALGSGIFGSAFVTLMIEILSDIRKNQDTEEQKKFAFADIKADILLLLGYEIRNFASYCHLYSEIHKIKNRAENIENVLNILNEYIVEINDHIYEDFNKGIIVVDKEWLAKDISKDKYLCLDALPYYERLLKNINKIIENKDTFFNFRILDQTIYDKIRVTGLLLHYIVVHSNSKSRDNTIEMKNQFFNQIKELFEFLNIDKNQTIQITIYS